MKRRSFIKKSSLISAPLVIGGVPLKGLANSTFSSFLNDDSDRVLVLIQLNGGNDGLATIIPQDQQDNLAAVRGNIFIPESDFLPITDTVALHPNMGGMKEVYDAGKMKIVQSVGYPNQNRSHFRSLDIWHTGSAADTFLSTGWVGRYLDSQFAGYPEDYPNEDCPDPFAITVGSVVSETCQGVGGNFSLTLSDPDNLSQLATPINNELADGCYGSTLDFMVNTIEQTNAYSEVIEAASAAGANMSTKYSEDDALAVKLKTVARLISGGLRTKIYVVNLGGFDTHANQVEDGTPGEGAHATLLQSLSDAVCAFQDDLQLLGIEQRVVGMTYSEFGRRIRSNFSFGTDHGTAAPLMVFGSCVDAGILGDNPEISQDVDNLEGVPMQYDFRSIYGSILMDWFDVEESAIHELLFEDFQYLPILQFCETNDAEDQTAVELSFKAFPNPLSSYATVEFETEGGWVKISIFDVIGNELKVVTSQLFGGGLHRMQIPMHDFPAGTYFFRMQTRSRQKTVRVVKV